MNLLKRSAVILLAAAAVALSAAPKELKVLTIGNSFSNSVFKTLPAIVKADPECRLVLTGANIGGCSLERHWKEHLKSEKDPAHRPYAKKYTLRQLLTKEKWDVVTIQQASRESWKAESYHPYAEKLISLIRELAPGAEIVIQQTWAYNSAAPSFAKWKITPDIMYSRLTENYTALAKQHKLRVIPSGYAVDLFRKALGEKLVSVSPADVLRLKEPELPETNDPAGNFSWRKNAKNGKKALRCDYNHLNPRGRYLQGLVWYAFLFGKDPEKSTYTPQNISPEEAALFKKCAARAVAGFPQAK
ncbi:MAG: DUF4886 domain-containing protein [Lentisphaeria bacterium]|nr:DUF4886 domain-containing protein [Lentisphaeria bacterium]